MNLRYVAFGILLVSLACPRNVGAEDGNRPEKVDLYDADSNHLWNRIHDALFTWKINDAEWLELDPLHWPSGWKIQQEAIVKCASPLLDDFVRTSAEKLVQDPLKRAIFQRDLWQCFDWLADPEYKDLPGREELQAQLAVVIHRVALSAEQILKLPDNYADAVKSKAFPAEYDPAQPERAFLPPDLWKDEGPWVLLGNEQAKHVAQLHVSFFGGRAAFFVFMRLPGGREITLNYLKQLKGLAPQQFPAGTEVALLRQTILIDDKGAILPTRLTETAQYRHYVDPNAGGGDPSQKYFEATFRRKDLFSGKFGGLHAAEKDDREFAFILFMGHNAGEGKELILQSCFTCHQAPGIQSVNSYMGFFVPQDGNVVLTAVGRNQEIARIVEWKKTQTAWRRLRELWAKEP